MSGESFEFDVVSCCGFIDIEKSVYFDHLKSVFKKYKFSSFMNSQFKQKKFSQNYSETKKIRKVSTQKLSEEFAFS